MLENKSSEAGFRKQLELHYLRLKEEEERIKKQKEEEEKKKKDSIVKHKQNIKPLGD